MISFIYNLDRWNDSQRPVKGKWPLQDFSNNFKHILPYTYFPNDDFLVENVSILTFVFIKLLAFYSYFILHMFF